jgi:hypothetical protein
MPTIGCNRLVTTDGQQLEPSAWRSAAPHCLRHAITAKRWPAGRSAWPCRRQRFCMPSVSRDSTRSAGTGRLARAQSSCRCVGQRAPVMDHHRVRCLGLRPCHRPCGRFSRQKAGFRAITAKALEAKAVMANGERRDFHGFPVNDGWIGNGILALLPYAPAFFQREVFRRSGGARCA